MYLGVREYTVRQANRRNALALAPSTWAKRTNEPIEFADSATDGDSGRLTNRTNDLRFDVQGVLHSTGLVGGIYCNRFHGDCQHGGRSPVYRTLQLGLRDHALAGVTAAAYDVEEFREDLAVVDRLTRP